jgi:hypothetical protein
MFLRCWTKTLLWKDCKDCSLQCSLADEVAGAPVVILYLQGLEGISKVHEVGIVLATLGYSCIIATLWLAIVNTHLMLTEDC